ncbi:hypothetical protein ACS5PN_26745 [Roseateles sp. NT4]|uniref:hypothetical protein n=1 Tax=Roseateles sp. NT4 TaxID=3453715 RepID=UPI003EEF71E3
MGNLSGIVSASAQVAAERARILQESAQAARASRSHAQDQLETAFSQHRSTKSIDAARREVNKRQGQVSDAETAQYRDATGTALGGLVKAVQGGKSNDIANALQGWNNSLQLDLINAAVQAQARGENVQQAIGREYQSQLASASKQGLSVQALKDNGGDEAAAAVSALSPRQRQLVHDRDNALTEGKKLLNDGQQACDDEKTQIGSLEARIAAIGVPHSDAQVAELAQLRQQLSKVNGKLGEDTLALTKLQTQYSPQKIPGTKDSTLPGTVQASYDAQIADAGVQQLVDKIKTATPEEKAALEPLLSTALTQASTYKTIAQASNALATKTCSAAELGSATVAAKDKSCLAVSIEYKYGAQSQSVGYYADHNDPAARKAVQLIDGRLYYVVGDKRAELSAPAARLWFAHERADQADHAWTDPGGWGQKLTEGVLDPSSWLANAGAITTRSQNADKALTLAIGRLDGAIAIFKAEHNGREPTVLEQRALSDKCGVGKALLEKQQADDDFGVLQAMQLLSKARIDRASGVVSPLTSDSYIAALERNAGQALTTKSLHATTLSPEQEAATVKQVGKLKLTWIAAKNEYDALKKYGASAADLATAAKKQNTAWMQLQSGQAALQSLGTQRDSLTAIFLHNRNSTSGPKLGTYIGLTDDERSQILATPEKQSEIDRLTQGAPEKTREIENTQFGHEISAKLYSAGSDLTTDIIPGEVPPGADVYKQDGIWYVKLSKDSQQLGVYDTPGHEAVIMRAGTYRISDSAAFVWETSATPGGQAQAASDMGEYVGLLGSDQGALPKDLGFTGPLTTPLNLTNDVTPLLNGLATACAGQPPEVQGAYKGCLLAIQTWQRLDASVQAQSKSGTLTSQQLTALLDAARAAVTARSRWRALAVGSALRKAEADVGRESRLTQQWLKQHPEAAGDASNSEPGKALLKAQDRVGALKSALAGQGRQCAVQEQDRLAAQYLPAGASNPAALYALVRDHGDAMAQTPMLDEYLKTQGQPTLMDRSALEAQFNQILGLNPKFASGSSLSFRNDAVQRVIDKAGNKAEVTVLPVLIATEKTGTIYRQVLQVRCLDGKERLFDENGYYSDTQDYAEHCGVKDQEAVVILPKDGHLTLNADGRAQVSISQFHRPSGWTQAAHLAEGVAGLAAGAALAFVPGAGLVLATVATATFAATSVHQVVTAGAAIYDDAQHGRLREKGAMDALNLGLAVGGAVVVGEGQLASSFARAGARAAKSGDGLLASRLTTRANFHGTVANLVGKPVSAVGTYLSATSTAELIGRRSELTAGEVWSEIGQIALEVGDAVVGAAGKRQQAHSSSSPPGSKPQGAGYNAYASKPDGKDEGKLSSTASKLDLPAGVDIVGWTLPKGAPAEAIEGVLNHVYAAGGELTDVTYSVRSPRASVARYLGTLFRHKSTHDSWIDSLQQAAPQQSNSKQRASTTKIKIRSVAQENSSKTYHMATATLKTAADGTAEAAFRVFHRRSQTLRISWPTGYRPENASFNLAQLNAMRRRPADLNMLGKSLIAPAPERVYAAAAHGSERWAMLKDGHVVNAREFAREIINDPGWGGKDILLYNCYAGAGRVQFAQELANTLRVKVYAADGKVEKHHLSSPQESASGQDLEYFGHLTSHNSDTGAVDNWRTFYPGIDIVQIRERGHIVFDVEGVGLGQRPRLELDEPNTNPTDGATVQTIAARRSSNAAQGKNKQGAQTKRSPVKQKGASPQGPSIKYRDAKGLPKLSGALGPDLPNWEAVASAVEELPVRISAASNRLKKRDEALHADIFENNISASQDRFVVSRVGPATVLYGEKPTGLRERKQRSFATYQEARESAVALDGAWVYRVRNSDRRIRSILQPGKAKAKDIVGGSYFDVTASGVSARLSVPNVQSPVWLHRRRTTLTVANALLHGTAKTAAATAFVWGGAWLGGKLGISLPLLHMNGGLNSLIHNSKEIATFVAVPLRVGMWLGKDVAKRRVEASVATVEKWVALNEQTGNPTATAKQVHAQDKRLDRALNVLEQRITGRRAAIRGVTRIDQLAGTKAIETLRNRSGVLGKDERDALEALQGIGLFHASSTSAKMMAKTKALTWYITIDRLPARFQQISSQWAKVGESGWSGPFRELSFNASSLFSTSSTVLGMVSNSLVKRLRPETTAGIAARLEKHRITQPLTRIKTSDMEDLLSAFGSGALAIVSGIKTYRSFFADHSPYTGAFGNHIGDGIVASLQTGGALLAGYGEWKSGRNKPDSPKPKIPYSGLAMTGLLVSLAPSLYSELYSAANPSPEPTPDAPLLPNPAQQLLPAADNSSRPALGSLFQIGGRRMTEEI